MLMFVLRSLAVYADQSGNVFCFLVLFVYECRMRKSFWLVQHSVRCRRPKQHPRMLVWRNISRSDAATVIFGSICHEHDAFPSTMGHVWLLFGRELLDTGRIPSLANRMLITEPVQSAAKANVPIVCASHPVIVLLASHLLWWWIMLQWHSAVHLFRCAQCVHSEPVIGSLVTVFVQWVRNDSHVLFCEYHVPRCQF